MLNNVITLNDAKEELSEMTNQDVQEMVLTVLEFRDATGYEVSQVLDVIHNLKNEDVGVSNKVLCASHNRNHWSVIGYLNRIGWIDDNNQLTEAGFRDMNDAHDVATVDIAEDVLVLQNYDGSLYWNRTHERFEDVWKTVLSNVPEERQYNHKLKETKPPISRQTRKMLLKIPNMTVVNNGDKVTK